MEKVVQTSLRLLGKVDLQKYGWVITAASILAYVCLQRGDRSNSEEESSTSKDGEDYNDVDGSQDNKAAENEESSEQSNNKGGASTTDDSSIQNDRRTKRNKGSVEREHRQMQQISQAAKDRNKLGVQQQSQAKKQSLEKDRKFKKSSNGALRNSRKVEFEDSYGDQQYEQDRYALSDIESRQFAQIKQHNALKKQRRYTSDNEETSQGDDGYRRNRILKIAKESAPGDGIFFQVLASLAENEEENE